MEREIEEAIKSNMCAMTAKDAPDVGYVLALIRMGAVLTTMRRWGSRN